MNVIDPGDMGGSIGTINPEMVQEMTVLTSSFGADQEFGPVVISTISKSGSDHFHGEAYFVARNDALNANDWQATTRGNRKAARITTIRAAISADMFQNGQKAVLLGRLREMDPEPGKCQRPSALHSFTGNDGR